MKHIIKKLLRESLLDEAMLNSSNLPKETALFQGKDRIHLVLFNPIANIAYAVISASLRGDNYDVDKVAAEKGFGPYIYELAMMMANMKGKGLMADRGGDVRDEAFKVWMKFADRTDVKKQQIAPFKNGVWNPEYSIAILTGQEDNFENQEEFNEYWEGLEPKEQDVLTKFNTGYSMVPSSDYQKMLAKSQEYIKKGFNPHKAFRAGSELFMNKYM